MEMELNNIWQLQEAKSKFSKVVEKAINTGPQIVTKNGKEAVVIISFDKYKDHFEPKDSIVSFFKKSPIYNANIEIDRKDDFVRELDL